MRFAVRTVSFLIVCALVVWAADQPKQVIKHVPVKTTSRVSGAEMYRNYCAVCHGLEGKGNGPAAPALKSSATDLTLLTKNNGGKFPELRLAYVLGMKEDIPAHGSKDMPIWGTLFTRMEGGDDSFTRLRIRNLVDHLASIQAK